MKILNISMNAPFTDGYSYQDNLLTEYQHKIGHEVFLLTGTRTRDINGKEITATVGRSTLENGVKLLRIEIGGKLRQFLGYYPEIKKILGEIQPDFIFIHGLASFVPAQAIAYRKKHPQVRIVADNHQDLGNTKVTGFPFAPILRFRRWCWKRWIPYVEHIYGTTSWRSAFAEEYYGIPAGKVDTLIMGVDSDRLPTDADALRSEVRSELGIGQDRFLFVSGGKLDARKKTIEMMTAFSRCKDKNAVLLLFGSVGADIQEDFSMLAETDSRIRYLGFIDSKIIYRYFYAADFGLFPGRHSVLWEEAVGCGLPCLFRRYGENDHMQVCENCIELPDNASVEEIEKVLHSVLEDHALYGKLKTNSLKAQSQFSYRSISEKSLS